jgi:Cu(I)/Ag(I) efflux system membrane fusion protein
MRKIIWLYLIIFVGLFSIVTSCNDSNKKVEKSTSKSKELYTCSMHPQILEDHPGDCPICGMKLIKKNAAPVAISNINLETLLKPTNEYVVASLPVTTPVRENIKSTVNVYGTIESDTRATGAISANVSGRIENLYLRYRFQNVKKGQKIAEIYSPELMTAQENLIFLLRNDAQNTSFITAAKQKLLLLGMSSSELNKVINSKKPLYKVSLYSKYSGQLYDGGMQNTNTSNNNQNSPVTQELSLREGMYVNKGQTLFRIMNNSKAWVALQIFPNQQSIVNKGDAVEITPETNPENKVLGTIDFIEPFFRAGSKTLTARVYFRNTEALTIGSQVTAKIMTNGKMRTWVPQSSVLSLGMNNVVFIKSKDGFKAHKISTGIRADDKIEILDGLEVTDSIAANAHYLIDSESFIQTSSK